MTKVYNSRSKDFVEDLPKFKEDLLKVFSHHKNEVINLKNVIINNLSQLTGHN